MSFSRAIDTRLGYLTATNNSLFITVVSGGQPGANLPGAIYKIGAPPLRGIAGTLSPRAMEIRDDLLRCP
jgi:hypothetical protein